MDTRFGHRITKKTFGTSMLQKDVLPAENGRLRYGIVFGGDKITRLVQKNRRFSSIDRINWRKTFGLHCDGPDYYVNITLYFIFFFFNQSLVNMFFFSSNRSGNIHAGGYRCLNQAGIS